MCAVCFSVAQAVPAAAAAGRALVVRRRNQSAQARIDAEVAAATAADPLVPVEPAELVEPSGADLVPVAADDADDVARPARVLTSA